MRSSQVAMWIGPMKTIKSADIFFLYAETRAVFKYYTGNDIRLLTNILKYFPFSFENIYSIVQFPFLPLRYFSFKFDPKISFYYLFIRKWLNKNPYLPLFLEKFLFFAWISRVQFSLLFSFFFSIYFLN